MTGTRRSNPSFPGRPGPTMSAAAAPRRPTEAGRTDRRGGASRPTIPGARAVVKKNGPPRLCSGAIPEWKRGFASIGHDAILWKNS